MSDEVEQGVSDTGERLEKSVVQSSQLEEKPRKKLLRITVLDVVVIGSIALLLGAILGPNIIRARAGGALTACKSNLKNIGTALEMYSTDWSGKYPDSMDKIVPNYLKTIPECRAAGRVTYRVQFGPLVPSNPKAHEDYYLVECVGENHKRVSITGNYPAYDGVIGLIERGN